jgi:hypothetical protein
MIPKSPNLQAKIELHEPDKLIRPVIDTGASLYKIAKR